MITKPDTFRKLIEQLGGVKPFATKMGLPPNTAKMMRDRNSVAVEHWPRLAEMAREAGLLLTTDDFTNMSILGAELRREAKAKRVAA